MFFLRATSKKGVRLKKPPSPFSKHGYTERNKNLLALGFRSYAEYLNSEMWKIIRGLAFEKHGTSCVSCEKRATQLHHSSYDMKTLAGADLSHLHPVCKQCHEAAEIVDGEKASHKNANEKIGLQTPSKRQQAKIRVEYERVEKGGKRPKWMRKPRR